MNPLCRVVAMLALASACSAAQTKAPERPTFPNTPTVNIPYADESVNFQRLNSLHMRLSFNGGADARFQIDTGSVGIMVAADEIPGYTGKGEPGEITYSSSGVHLIGTWETVDVKFEDAKMPDGSPAVAHMQVLAVTKRECLGTGVNAAHCEPGPGHPHMLGIGFGRGDGTDWKVQQRNAFVMLNAMQQGRMRRGYVLSPQGVQLGLNAASMQGEWKWQKLEPRTAVPPADSTAPQDWTTAAGTIEVAGKKLGMGTVLIDTGLTNMMISSPGTPESGNLPDGVPVKVYLLGGQFHYDFVTGDLRDPETPRKVSWRKPKDATFVNTGLRALAHFDYAYDADAGFLGLKYRP